MNVTDLAIEIGMIRDEERVAGIEYLSRLVRQEDWKGIAALGDEVVGSVRGLIDTHRKDKCLLLLKSLAEEHADRFNKEIKQALKGVTSFHIRGALGEKLIQLEKRAEDKQRRANLLTIAFADRLTDLVFPAADRAAKLTNLIVKDKPSPEAERYLEEASLCYFYELYSASAVMCRSVLEELIEKRLKRLEAYERGELTGTDYTLGVMLGFAERTRRIVPMEALHAAQTVNRLGSVAVHERPVGEEEAWECLTAARYALICILR